MSKDLTSRSSDKSLIITNRSEDDRSSSTFYTCIKGLSKKESSFKAALKKRQEKEKNKAVIENELDPSKSRKLNSNYEFNNINTDPALIIQEKLRKGLINLDELPDLKDLFGEKSDFKDILEKDIRRMNYSNKVMKLRKNKQKKFNVFDFENALKNREEMLMFEPDDSFDLLSKDKDVVKKLSVWDDNKNLNEHKNLGGSIQINKDVDAMKMINDIKSKYANMTFMSSKNSFINAILKQSETEISIILLMNINLSKKKFQFDAFQGKSKHPIELPKEIVPKNKKTVELGLKYKLGKSLIDMSINNPMKETCHTQRSSNLPSIEVETIDQFIKGTIKSDNATKSLYLKSLYSYSNYSKHEDNNKSRLNTSFSNNVTDSHIKDDDELLNQKFKHLAVVMKDSDDYCKIDEKVVRSNKFNYEASYFKYSNIDKYRIIIKDRMKIEQANRKE